MEQEYKNGKKNSKISCVLPTIRPESYKRFLKAWGELFKKHNVELVVVLDGKNPTVNGKSLKEVMGKYSDSMSNFNGGIRNLGFAYVAKYLPNVEYILTVDDDVVPLGDTIQDHLDILNKRVPISWISTASEYMRGFPYLVRNEAEVVVSHGVWEGVADWDAPTQLVLGNRPVEFYKGVVPKGAYFPMCSMNLAFKRKALPFIYHFPAAPEMQIGRTDDIYAGVITKRELDKKGWAAVTGFARVVHQRESNVYKNLQKEALEIELMETFWQGDESHPYFDKWRKMYKSWLNFLKQCQI